MVFNTTPYKLSVGTKTIITQNKVINSFLIIQGTKTIITLNLSALRECICSILRQRFIWMAGREKNKKIKRIKMSYT